MLTGHNWDCNSAGRITSAACVLWHWFTIEENYGDSHWLIGLLFLTQGSVSLLTNSSLSDRTWLYKRPLSPSLSLCPSVSLSLSPEFLLCPAHVCVIAVIIDRHSPSVSIQYQKNPGGHKCILMQPLKLMWKNEAEKYEPHHVLNHVLLHLLLHRSLTSHSVEKDCTWTCTHREMHMFGASHAHTHTPTNCPNKPPPAAHTHTFTHRHALKHTHKHSFGGTTDPLFKTSVPSVCCVQKRLFRVSC